MEYQYYNVELGWDEEADKPKKVYNYERGVNDPHPKTIFDKDLGKEVPVKFYFSGAPAGFVH